MSKYWSWIDFKELLFNWLVENEVFGKMFIFGDNDVVYIFMYNSFIVDVLYFVMVDELRINKLCLVYED